MADKLKFVLAVLLLAAGVVGFYLLDKQAMIFRVLSVFAGVFAAIAVAWYTSLGQRCFVFSKEAVAETKKVVWPSGKETRQTTGVVFAFACVMALFLWLTDFALEGFLQGYILGWK